PPGRGGEGGGGRRRRGGGGGAPREQQSQSSLPGLTPQVGFIRLAAHYTAQLGRARVAMQSIFFARSLLRRGWTRGSSPRVTEGLRRETLPLTRTLASLASTLSPLRGARVGPSALLHNPQFPRFGILLDG